MAEFEFSRPWVVFPPLAGPVTGIERTGEVPTWLVINWKQDDDRG